MRVASTLHEKGVLAASFFWDKNQPGSGLDSLASFPSTLARQLAAFNDYYRITLYKHLQQSPYNVQGFALKEQMKGLILDPMDEMKEWLSLGKGRWVIILDGLDECGDQETLEELMEVVLMLDQLPPKFTILISCRPEPQLHKAWKKFKPDVPFEDIDKINEDQKFYIVR